MLISLKDKTTGKFGAPILCATEDEARRNLVMVFLSGEKSMITTFPSHYQLYSVGDFDVTDGILTPVAPKFIIDGITAKKLALEEIQAQQLDVTPSPSGDEESEVTNA